jgi:hypothetical protein
MRKWLILLTLLAAGPAAAVPVWKWVDASGQVHYTDVPVPGAERIELTGVQSIPAPRSRTSNAEAGRTATAALERTAYQRFVIVSPAEQQTLWNIGAMLNVQVDIAPPLQDGDRIDVFLDGQRVSVNATSTQFTVPDVYRGVHTLQAVIVDSNGKDVLRSLAVTFVVQQTSVLNPNNNTPPAVRHRAGAN